MGANIGLVGPGMYALVGLVLADAIAAVLLVFDAWRRPATDYAGVPEGRWFYIVPQVAYVAVYVVAQVPATIALMPWANSYPLCAPVIVALQFAYLLRVVFPTHERLEARLEARFRDIVSAVGVDCEEEPTTGGSTTNA